MLIMIILREIHLPTMNGSNLTRIIERLGNKKY
jgi:hypothetical protein